MVQDAEKNLEQGELRTRASGDGLRTVGTR